MPYVHQTISKLGVNASTSRLCDLTNSVYVLHYENLNPSFKCMSLDRLPDIDWSFYAKKDCISNSPSLVNGTSFGTRKNRSSNLRLETTLTKFILVNIFPICYNIRIRRKFMSKNLLNRLNETLTSGILFEYVDQSLASMQVLRKLGFSEKGQYNRIVKDFLIDNDIDISHFTARGVPPPINLVKICICCGNEFTCIARKTKEQVTCSRACSNTYFRSGPNNGNFIDGHNNYRKKALDYYDKVCVRCGYSNELALEVHHKNKNRLDNSIDNLEVLCCNCHTIEHKLS